MKEKSDSGSIILITCCLALVIIGIAFYFFNNQEDKNLNENPKIETVNDNKHQLLNEEITSLKKENENLRFTIDSLNNSQIDLLDNENTPPLPEERVKIALITSDLSNFLYAGINNPLSISVPGIPLASIHAFMTGGTLIRDKHDGWIAKPDRIGQECLVSVSATIDGKTTPIGTKTFRTKELPNPVPYIACKDYNDIPTKYRGGKPIPKATLLKATKINAEVSDQDLDVRYRILSFDMVVFRSSTGEMTIHPSDNENFSIDQQAQLKMTIRNQRFYITNIKAIGPDRVQRTLSPIEVIVN